MGRTIELRRSCAETIEAAVGAIGRRGFTAVRSFDLQSARALHADDCPCPHHGSSDCTCQYVVLLVYPAGPGSAEPPHVVTAHEFEGVTRLTLNGAGGELGEILQELEVDNQ